MKRSKQVLSVLMCIAFVLSCQKQKESSNTKAEVVNPLILNPDAPVNDRVNAILEELTLEEKVIQLDGNYPPGIPRVGMPEYFFGNEALHGIMRPGKATVFPQAIGFAASWNPRLIHEVATAISDEARAKHNETNGEMQLKRSCGLLTFWSPNVNMARDPRWGRTAETYGEDPFLTSRIGVSFVKGLQGNNPNYMKTIATPKHFVANNEEHNRFECQADIPEKVLREYYLPAFKAAIVEGKAGSVMSAYNAVNGVPCSANKFLLTDVLRKEWGFKGYVVTDCGAVEHLHLKHKYASSFEEATEMVIDAGVDLECGNVFRKYLKKSVEEDRISKTQIDTALSRVLHAKMELGMFDPDDRVPFNKLKGELVGSKKHQNLALKSAEESMVLLKNELINGNKLLPIDSEKIKTIAVLGPNSGIAQFGDYSGVPVNPAVTPNSGIKKLAKTKGIDVNYVQWEGDNNDDEYEYIPIRLLNSTNQSNGGKGIKASYYYNTNDVWGQQTASIERVEDKIHYDGYNTIIDPAIPEGKFSVQWNTWFTAPYTGTYKFAITANDGVKFSVDWERKLVEWYDQDKKTHKITLELEKGKRYHLRLDHYHNTGKPFFDMKVLMKPNQEITPFEREIKAAKVADMVIAVVGLGDKFEMEGTDKTTLNLPQQQQDFIKKIMKTNPNTVLVLVNGSPLSINWATKNVPAILEAWYPGEQGGNAIANVLFGECNPGGKLPVTFYDSENNLPDFNDYDIRKGRTYMYYKGEPLYEFGYGLSYSTFEIQNLRLEKEKYSESETMKVNVDVANTGNIDGDEVVQVYIKYDNDKNAPKKLKGFKRVHVKKGRKDNITIEMPLKSLETWNVKKQIWEVKPGRYSVLVGNSSKNIQLESKISIQ
ncbi:glycoside hydrolase family 3 C-terminal domain-containing protein [Joostella atrarenae]|uniref:Glycoside hydrolase family 3 C-terminal domain-containing protein n=1 Tax=Joostella atrarenae TaxID=679257 RepID=A0ABS9J2N5_9FLAO|nr:glycoside hydrolase family 3 C-terminal domain-containing protein [Joostella atrarenae]MCF8714698.1 glycoside hydrolase family 3 C-terminal domain-containing protein [Joostella atrarenae]